MSKFKANLLGIVIVLGLIVGFFSTVAFCSWVDTKYPEFWGKFAGVCLGIFVICLILYACAKVGKFIKSYSDDVKYTEEFHKKLLTLKDTEDGI